MDLVGQLPGRDQHRPRGRRATRVVFSMAVRISSGPKARVLPSRSPAAEDVPAGQGVGQGVGLDWAGW